MLGAALDYRLLRPLARRPAAPPDRASFGPQTVAEGVARLRKFNDRLGGRIPLSKDLRYLDVGCGFGEMTVALARESGGFVSGVDIVAEHIEGARRLAESASLDSSRTSFDVGGWEDLAPDRQFDVVLSHEAMEHYAEPFRFLQKARDLLKDDRSVLVMGFGPLFHATFNVHVDWMFRIPIPWMV